MTDPTITIALTIPAAAAHKLSESFEGTLADAALTALKLYHGLGAPARATLQTLSEQHNTTPAKTLRMAIDHFQKDTTRLRLGSGAAGRPVVNQDRDAEIYARIKTGFTHAAVAAEFDISLVRVGQIVARQRAMRNEPTRPKKILPLPRYNLALEVDQGATIPSVAAKYGMTVEAVRLMYAKYRGFLPAAPTKLDCVNAAIRADQDTTPEPTQPPQTVQPAPEAQEVLSLKTPEELTTAAPTQPKVLAVIPPSMRNPELFRTAEERPQPVPADKLNMDIFQDDYPLEQVFDLRGVEPGRVAYTNTPKK
jgi:hypothetical protein